VRSLSRAGADCDSPVVITPVAYRVIYDAAQLRFPAWRLRRSGWPWRSPASDSAPTYVAEASRLPRARTVVTSAIIFWRVVVAAGRRRL
jgi:hypothetical protein